MPLPLLQIKSKFILDISKCMIFRAESTIDIKVLEDIDPSVFVVYYNEILAHPARDERKFYNKEYLDKPDLKLKRMDERYLDALT